MIGRLLDRVPVEVAIRWGRAAALVQAVFMAGFFVAWLGFGLRTWARHNLTAPEAMLLGAGWVPVAVVSLSVQAVAGHIIWRYWQETLTQLEALRRLHEMRTFFREGDPHAYDLPRRPPGVH